MFPGKIIELVKIEGITYLKVTDKSDKQLLIPYNGNSASVGGGI